MALDGIVVANLAAELNDKLAGSRIARIAQPEKDALYLTLKGSSGQFRLLMSADASLPLLYLTQEKKTAPLTAPNFCMLLRKHLANGRILRIWQPSLERIVHFEVEHYDELGDLRRKELIIELMGKHSNIIFCDSDGTIIDSIKRISAQTSSVREVLPGRAYFIPETQAKADPLAVSAEGFQSTVFSKAMPLSKAIYASYTGISPVIAEELCHRAGAESDQSANTIEEPLRTRLYHIFARMMEDVANKRFVPNLILNEHAEPVEFSSLPLTMYSDMQVQEEPTISKVLETYYAMRDTLTRIRQKSSDLRRIVAGAIDRTAKKLDLQRRQMADTEKKEKYRLYGELLHTYGYEAQPGARQLTALNYYTNEELTIPLDDTLTAAENAKRYFDRYTKLKRTQEALTEQIKASSEDLEQLLSIRTFLDMALEEADLVQVRQELVESGYIRKKSGSQKIRVISRPYHYRTADGYDLYVGKNNFQNDELTFKFASNADWWFHAKGAPGSHVIARVHGTEELPDHVFEDAARLAAWYSSNRAAGKVEVDYVERRHVKKPGGAKPGFVVYYTNYSMVIDADISALELVADKQ